MRKIFGVIVVGLVLVSAVHAPVFAQSASPIITSLHADVVLNKDRTVEVTETVTYQFPEYVTSFVPYRTFTDQPQRDGWVRSFADMITLADEQGNRIPSTESQDDEDIEIFSDEPMLVTNPERHIVVFSYQLRNALIAQTDTDQFQWSFSSFDWGESVERATVRVILPEKLTEGQGISLVDTCGTSTCSTDNLFDYQNKTAFIVTSPGTLDDAGAMTIQATFPKGIFSEPVESSIIGLSSKAQKYFQWYARIPTIIYLSAGVFGIIMLGLVGWIVLAYLPESRRRSKPIVTQYNPPAGMSPSQVSYLYYGKERRDSAIFGDIMYLVSYGYVTIHHKTMTKKNFWGNRLTIFFEMLVLFALGFGIGRWIGIGVVLLLVLLNGKKTWRRIKGTWSSETFSLERTGKSASDLPRHLQEMLDILAPQNSTVQSFQDLKREQNNGSFRLCILRGFEVIDGWYPEGARLRQEAEAASKTAWKRVTQAFGFSLLLFILGGLAMGFLPIQHPFGTLPLIAGLLASAIVALVVYYFKTRMVRKHEGWYLVAGLKQYIDIAEEERIKFEHDPEKSLDTFSHLLPYAMVFGLEDKWNTAFEGRITGVPGWFDGVEPQDLVDAIPAVSSEIRAIGTSGKKMLWSDGAPKKTP